MRYFVLAVFCLSVVAFAQTKTLKSKALIQCEANQQQSQTTLQYTLKNESDLAKQVDDLQAKNAELTKKVSDLTTAAREVLDYTQRLDKEYASLTAVYDSMVAQLNHQTAATQERQAAAAERMAAAQEETARLNRARAVFGFMQATKPQPYILPLPQQPQRVTGSCTSRVIGTTTYTDCN